jgi:hypothetical protein
MTSYFSNLAKISGSLSAWLPQNDHAKKADALAQKIQSLEQSLSDKTGQVFQSKVSETTTAIQEEKQKCIQDLDRMNGSYYQDPKSTLKMAWDRLVNAVEIAIGFKVERADQLDAVSVQLDVDPNEAKKTAKEKIDHFKVIEQKRDKRQNRLNQIIGLEKTASNVEDDLKLRKELLKQKHRELCGNYFADPNGELHKAWEKYQTTLAEGSTGENSLKEYQQLDEYRKQIEAELYHIDTQLLIPASTRTYEILTIDSIAQEINRLKEIQKTESSLSGVDWSGIASNAAKVASIGAGYIFLT